MVYPHVKPPPRYSEVLESCSPPLPHPENTTPYPPHAGTQQASPTAPEPLTTSHINTHGSVQGLTKGQVAIAKEPSRPYDVGGKKEEESDNQKKGKVKNYKSA